MKSASNEEVESPTSLFNAASFSFWSRKNARQDSERLSLDTLRHVTAMMVSCYGSSAPAAFEEVRDWMQSCAATTSEVLAYSPLNVARANDADNASVDDEEQPCYGCTQTFVENLLRLLRFITGSNRLVRDKLVEEGALEELYQCNIRNGPLRVRSVAMVVIYRLCETSVMASQRVCDMFLRRVETVIDEAIRCPALNQNAVEALLPDMDLLDLLLQPSSVDGFFDAWKVRIQMAFHLFNKIYSLIESSETVVPQCIFQYVLAPMFFSFCNLMKDVLSVDIEIEHPTSLSEFCSEIQRSIESVKSKISGKGDGDDGKKDDAKEGEKEGEVEEDGDGGEDDDSECDPEYPLLFTGKILKESDGDKKQEEQSEMTDGDETKNAQASAKNCREIILARFARLWKVRIGHSVAKIDSIADLISVESFRMFMLCPKCELVRQSFVILVASLVRGNPEFLYPVLDTMLKMFPSVLSVPIDVSFLYYSFLFNLLEEDSLRCYIEVRHHFTQMLVDCLKKESTRIDQVENSGMNIGYPAFGASLWIVTRFIYLMLGVDTIRARFKQGNHTSSLLSAFIKTRSLVVNISRFTIDASKSSWDLLLLLQEGDADNTAFMRACVDVMVSLATTNPRASAFVMEQLMGMVEPKKPTLEYFLDIQKIRSQAEYIAGNMEHNPYSTKDIGATMRDVKKKICITLNMPGLLEDDNGLELLVDGNIINLNIPIRLVYEKVWLPNHPLDDSYQTESDPSKKISMLRKNPMKVIFRLQGFDGEATEPMIDTLQEDVVAEDTATRDKMISVIMECGGMNALLSLLKNTPSRRILQDRDLISGAFKLLALCCKIPENCEILLAARGLETVVVKLREMVQTLSNLRGATTAVQGQLEQLFDAGLTIASPLAQKATEAAASAAKMSDGQERSFSPVSEADLAVREENIKVMVAALSNPALTKNKSISEGIHRLVPVITFGNPVLCEHLAQYIGSSLKDGARFSELDEAKVRVKSDVFDEIKNSLNVVNDLLHYSPPAFKTYLDTCSLKLHALLCKHLQTVYQNASSSMTDEKNDVMSTVFSLPSVTAVLEMLLNLVTGHAFSQTVMLECGDIVSLLHSMEERRADTTGVGLLAETVLDAMHDSAEAKKAVDDIRDAERKEKEALAKKKREQLLKQMGMKQSGQKILMKMAAFDMPEDESGLSCLVCQEGYTFKPDDALGVYVYHYRCPMHSFLLTKAGTNYEGTGVMTITAFNCIHFNCHKAATRGERAKKQPMSEWDAAMVRNQMVHCNAILPLCGPKLSKSHFMEGFSQFISGIPSRGGIALTVMVHDLMFMLMRLCYEGFDVFDTQQLLEIIRNNCEGKKPTSVELGGRESTLQLCPWMIALMSNLERLDTKLDTVNDRLRTFLSTEPKSWAHRGEDSNNPLYFLAMTLPFMTLPQWNNSKLAILRSLIGYAYAEGTACREEADDAVMQSLDTNGVFETCQPALVMMLLVDRMQQTLKQKLPKSNTLQQSDLNALEHHIIEMGKDISDAFAKLYGELDEMKSYADFQEVFDVLELLGPVEDAMKSVPPDGASNASEAFALSLWHSFVE